MSIVALLLGWQQWERAAGAAAGRVLPLCPPAVASLPGSLIPPSAAAVSPASQAPGTGTVSGGGVSISTFFKIQFNLIHMNLLLKQYMVTMYHLTNQFIIIPGKKSQNKMFFFYTRRTVEAMLCVTMQGSNFTFLEHFFRCLGITKRRKCMRNM